MSDQSLLDTRDVLSDLINDIDDRVSGDRELKTLWYEKDAGLRESDSCVWRRFHIILEKKSGAYVRDNHDDCIEKILNPGYQEPKAYFDELTNKKTGEVTALRFNPSTLVKDILETERFLIRSVEGKNGRLWRYSDGCYRPDGDTYIKRKLAEVVGPEYYHLTNRLQRLEVLDAVRNASFKDDKELVDNTDLLPVKNGVLNWHTLELRPYDKDRDVFFFQIPVLYDPKATNPLIDQWLHEIAASGGADAIIDYMAECLYRRAMKYHFIGYGPPHTAKTTLSKVIRRFLGPDSVANVKLQRIARDRFAAAGLEDKMANVYADIGKGAIRELGEINATTGTDSLKLERKGVDSRSGFEPYAKHLYLTNDLPRLETDVGERCWEVMAFFERFGLIKFEQVYSASPRPGSSEKKRIEHFEDRVTTDAELSGLLNIILQAMPNAVQNGPRVSMSAKDSMMLYLRQSNPLQAFILDCVEFDKEFETSKEALKVAFNYYRDLNEVAETVIGDAKIKDSLSNQAITGYYDEKWAEGRKHWWMGIRINIDKLPKLEDGEIDAKTVETVTKGTRRIADRPPNPKVAPGIPRVIDNYASEPVKLAPESPAPGNSLHKENGKSNSVGCITQNPGGVGAAIAGKTRPNEILPGETWGKSFVDTVVEP